METKKAWGYLVIKGDKLPVKQGALSTQREEILPTIYDNIEFVDIPFPEKSGFILTRDKKCGYADIQGSILLEPCYDHLKIINSDLAQFKSKNRYGFLNNAFEELIPPFYSQIYNNKNGELVGVFDNIDSVLKYSDILDGTLYNEIQEFLD